MTFRQCVPVRACVLTLLLVATVFGWPQPAHADSHALILWIGQYADPRVRIEGVENDAILARGMARAMGVPSANIVERSNTQLTHAGLKIALAELGQRVRTGDGVFIYFSGHGRQLQRLSGGAGCSEGLATYEGGIYFDLLLRNELDALAARADRVLMFNDSCFSGGAATKALSSTTAVGETIPKSYPLWTSNTPATTANCGTAVNLVSKVLGGLPQQGATTGVVYLAGAAADEAAYPGAQGSVATRAWASCLQSLGGDGQSDEVRTVAELQACAQKWVQRNSRYAQTITLVGDAQLPLRLDRHLNRR